MSNGRNPTISSNLDGVARATAQHVVRSMCSCANSASAQTAKWSCLIATASGRHRLGVSGLAVPPMDPGSSCDVSRLVDAAKLTSSLHACNCCVNCPCDDRFRVHAMQSYRLRLPKPSNRRVSRYSTHAWKWLLAPGPFPD